MPLDDAGVRSQYLAAVPPGSYGTTLAPPGVVLAPPGVVLIPQWRPDPGDAVSADGAETPLYYGYAGVGRK